MPKNSHWIVIGQSSQTSAQKMCERLIFEGLRQLGRAPIQNLSWSVIEQVGY